MVSKLEQLRLLRERDAQPRLRAEPLGAREPARVATGTPQAASRSGDDLGQRQPSLRRLGRPLDKDRHLSLSATQPWIAEGMSERTWYRRQKEAKT